MDVGGLGQAAGSAYVEHGRTKVVCAVNGPMEVSKRDKVSDFASLQLKHLFVRWFQEFLKRHNL